MHIDKISCQKFYILLSALVTADVFHRRRKETAHVVGWHLFRGGKTLSSIPFCLNVSFGVQIRRGDAATMSQEGADGVGFIGDSFGIRRGPENFIAG